MVADRVARDRAGRDAGDEILRRAGLARGDLDPVGRLVDAAVIPELGPRPQERRAYVHEHVVAADLRRVALELACENEQLFETPQVEQRIESEHARERDHLREPASARELERARLGLERRCGAAGDVLEHREVLVHDRRVSALAARGPEQGRLANVVDAVDVPEVEPRQPPVAESHRRPVDTKLRGHRERALGALDARLRVTSDRPRRPALRERVEELDRARPALDQCHRVVDQFESVRCRGARRPTRAESSCVPPPGDPLPLERRNRPLEQVGGLLGLPSCNAIWPASAMSFVWPGPSSSESGSARSRCEAAARVSSATFRSAARVE